jgi:hypothetical protein
MSLGKERTEALTEDTEDLKGASYFTSLDSRRDA